MHKSLCRRFQTSLVFLLCVVLSAGNSWACPFCSAVSQTLRQEMSAMDTVAIAKIIPGSETDSTAQFRVSSIIRGDKLITTEQKLTINYFGKPKEDQNFLIMGVDPPELLWSSPLPVSDVAVKYVEAIQKLPEENVKRLEFFINYLEHPESLLARDAYDEFASAPYSEIIALKPRMDRKQLLEWVQDTNLPPDRKRLYLVMLGVCGEKEDTKLLEKMLTSDDPNRRAGLDAMIACYITLMGDSGLDLIDKQFLKNEKSQYADTYAAIMALRFHGTDGGVIKKERVLKSMRLILDRPALADLVIPDLARWEDWSQIEKLTGLFKSADEKSSWVRVPVINYLRACPLPEAEKAMAELKELDPAAYKRATRFFPIPKSDDSSSVPSPEKARGIVSDSFEPLLPSEEYAAVGYADSASTAGYSIASRGSLGETKNSPTETASNRLSAISVVTMFSVTLWLAMWLFLGGAGNSPWLALFRRR
ncbi:MAG: hypothetical protein VXZ82_19325 [Planctomycetota bacterium]|nr:hypothetical protein [Planctomycetota bacterium]